jgi:hypothetical protein
MSKKTFSILLVVLIYLIFILDTLAIHYFLYWRWWWFDIILHFLGGAWVALFSYYLFFLSGYFNKIIKRMSVFVLSLTLAITVGIIWEVFEYFMKVSLNQSNYLLDTSLDLLMDMLGWLGAYFFVIKFFPKRFLVAEDRESDKIRLEE